MTTTNPTWLFLVLAVFICVTSFTAALVPAVLPSHYTCVREVAEQEEALYSNGGIIKHEFAIRVTDTPGNTVWCFATDNKGGILLKDCDGSNSQKFQWSTKMHLLDHNSRTITNIPTTNAQGTTTSGESFTWGFHKSSSDLNVMYTRRVSYRTADAKPCAMASSLMESPGACHRTAWKEGYTQSKYRSAYDSCIQRTFEKREACTLSYLDASQHCLVNSNGVLEHHFDCKSKRMLMLYNGPFCGCGSKDPTSPKGKNVCIDIDECADPKLHDCDTGDGTRCSNAVSTKYTDTPYYCKCRAGQELDARIGLPDIRLESDRGVNECTNAMVELLSGRNSLEMKIKSFGADSGAVMLDGKEVRPLEKTPDARGMYTYIKDLLKSGVEYQWTFRTTGTGTATQAAEIDGIKARTWCGSLMGDKTRTNVRSAYSTGTPKDFRVKQLSGRITFEWVDQSLCENAFQVSRNKIDITASLNTFSICPIGKETVKGCMERKVGVLIESTACEGLLPEAKSVCYQEQTNLTLEECEIACLKAGHLACSYLNWNEVGGVCGFVRNEHVGMATVVESGTSVFRRTPKPFNKMYIVGLPAEVFANEVAVASEFRVHLTEPSGALVNPGTMLSDDLVQDSELAIGNAFRYCIIATHTSDAEDTSMPLCQMYPTVIYFDYRVRLFTGLAPSLGSIPVYDVIVSWRLGPKEAGINGTATTDDDGYAIIDTESSSEKVYENEIQPLVVTLSKVSGKGLDSVTHKFLCEGTEMDCTNDVTFQIRHLDFNRIIRFVDDTVVPVSGRVYQVIGDSANKVDCPLDMQRKDLPRVCLVDKSKRESDLATEVKTGVDTKNPSQKKEIGQTSVSVPGEIVCTEVNGAGEYELAAPVGLEVQAVLVFEEHSHVRRGAMADGDWFKIQADKVYVGVDIEDTQVDDINMELWAGECPDSPFYSMYTVLLTPPHCPTAAFTRTVIGGAIGAGRFESPVIIASVPATRWQISVKEVKVTNGMAADGLQVVMYLEKAYGQFLEIDMHNPDVDQEVKENEEKDKSIGELGNNSTSTNQDGESVTTQAAAVVNKEDPLPGTEEYTAMLISQYEARKLHFEYHPDPTVISVFTNSETANYPACKTRPLFEVYTLNAPAESNAQVSIQIQEQFFGTGVVCPKFSGKVYITNGLGELASDARQLVGADETSLAYCSLGCEFDVKYNETTKESGLDKYFLIGRPNPVAPHIKLFSVSALGTHTNRVNNDYSVVVLGHFVDEGSPTSRVPLPQWMPLLVVRDPPGGSSTAFYKAGKTSVSIDTGEYESFAGFNAETEFQVGGGVDSNMVLGIGMAMETDNMKVKYSLGLKNDIDFKHLIMSDGYENTAGIEISWSMTTGDNPLVAGPLSDMFLVPDLSMEFLEVINVFMVTDKCEAGENTIVTANPDDLDKGFSWVSRYHIEAFVLPKVQKIKDSVELKAEAQRDDKDKVILKLATSAFDGWTKMLEETDQELADMFSDLGSKFDAMTPLGKESPELIPEVFEKKMPNIVTNEDGVPNVESNADAGEAKVAAAAVIGTTGTIPVATILAQAAVNAAVSYAQVAAVEKDASVDADAPPETPRSGATLLAPVIDKDQPPISVKQMRTTAHRLRFVGGGANYEYSKSASHENNYHDHHKPNTKFSFEGHVGLKLEKEMSVVGFGKNGEGVIMAGTEGEGMMLSFVVKTVIEESGFSLGDPDQGDWFEVDIREDPRYGTYAFKTVTGETRCPPEPSTIVRERPMITQRAPLFRAGQKVHPDKPALIHLSLENIGLGNDVFPMQLYTLNDRMGQDGASMQLNGASLSVPKVLENMGNNKVVDITLEIFRGPEAYVYDDLMIGMRSFCAAYGDDDANGYGYATLGLDPPVTDYMEIALPKIEFAEPCPELNLIGDIAREDVTVVTKASKPEVHVPFLNRAIVSLKKTAHVDEAFMEYRQINSIVWNKAKKRVINQPVENVEIDLISEENESGFTVASWDTTTLQENIQDGEYELRGRVKCKHTGTGDASLDSTYSKSFKVLVDRVEPQHFGAAEPSDRVYEFGDELSVSFNEDIDCFKPYKFDVKVIIEGMLSGVNLNENNLHVLCKNNKITVAVPPKLVSLTKLTDRRAVLFVDDVKDIAGNPSTESVVHAFKFKNEAGTEAVDQGIGLADDKLIVHGPANSGQVKFAGTIPNSIDDEFRKTDAYRALVDSVKTTLAKYLGLDRSGSAGDDQIIVKSLIRDVSAAPGVTTVLFSARPKVVALPGNLVEEDAEVDVADVLTLESGVQLRALNTAAQRHAASEEFETRVREAVVSRTKMASAGGRRLVGAKHGGTHATELDEHSVWDVLFVLGEGHGSAVSFGNRHGENGAVSVVGGGGGNNLRECPSMLDLIKAMPAPECPPPVVNVNCTSA